MMSNKEIDGRQEKRELKPIIDEETKRRLWADVKEKNPTPDHVLETQLRDPRIPKDEIVHYAARCIAELEAQLAEAQAESERLRQVVKAGDHLLAKAQAENERLRDSFILIKAINTAFGKAINAARGEG